ncbi:MAG: phosphoribosyltransferase family protein, partial [Bacteroidota bacterium]
MKTKVLNHPDIEKIIKRMAYQIYENNFGDKQITLVGIKSKGYEIAKLLQAELDTISPLKSSLLEVTMDKEQPTPAGTITNDSSATTTVT